MSRGVAEPPDVQRQTYPSRGGYGAVLANAAFLRLWLSQAISQTAQQTINFALLVQVRAIIEARGVGGGNTALSLLILCFATPPILFSALAGVIVDRANKRAIMTGVNIARASAVAGYLLIDPGWPILTTLLYIYALCFSFSTVGQLFGPAEGATIPQLIPRERLLNANALFSLTFTASQLLGFVILGPFLTNLVGLRTIYVTAVLVYLLCTGLVLSLPSTPAVRNDPATTVRRTVWGDLREVRGFIACDRLLRKAIAYLTVANAGFLMLATLAPEFNQRVLRLPVDRLATIVTPAGLGMLVGVFLVGRLGRRLPRERLIDRALIAAGGFLLAFAGVTTLLARAQPERGGIFSPAVLASMVFAAGLGIANAFLIVPSQTLLQERSDEAIRGRVISAFFTTANTAALAPILLAGILGDLFGVVRILVTLGLLTLALGLWAERRRRHREALARQRS